MRSLHLFELQAYFPQRSTDFHVYNLGSREGADPLSTQAPTAQRAVPPSLSLRSSSLNCE